MADQFSNSKAQACEELGSVDVSGGSCTSGESTFHRILADIVNVVAWVGGLIGVIMIIVASMRFITSGGESAKVAAAKNSLMWALVGITILVIAEVLVHFVLGETAQHVVNHPKSSSSQGVRPDTVQSRISSTP